MSVSAIQDLIHADIDGELDGAQRAQLARALLADPEARALHDDLKRLSTAFDALPSAEPPPGLAASILAALPQKISNRARPGWLEHRWRYAALVAGVLVAGSLVFKTVHGPGADTTEMSGTLAAAPSILDTVALPSRGELSGQVTLYHDAVGFGLRFQLAASGPVNASISSAGHTFEVRNVAPATGRPDPTVPLAAMKPGQEVVVVLSMRGRDAGRLSLRVP